MSITAHFNTKAKGPARPTPQSMGLELLALVQRKRDGSSENLTLNERAIALVEQGASLTVSDPEHGRTPLMWATIHCRPRIISAILAQAPDLLQRDKAQKTALDLARQFKSKPAIELLEEAEKQYRAKILEETKNVATRRATAIRKPLNIKRKPRGTEGQE
jgi:hypothetical protein